VQGGTGIEVDGAGTEINPYVINVASGTAGGGGGLTVTDTATINLTLLGEGTTEEPYLLSGHATVSLDELLNVADIEPTEGQVLAWNGTVWQPIPATTAPAGAVAVGSGLLGDGSAGDPLRIDPTSTAGFVVPTGLVTPWAGPGAPSGWLLCNDTPVSRATYANLFDVIGTTYGDGDGSTTFNVPNMANRFPVGTGGGYVRGWTIGSSTHSHSIPAHTHTLPGHTHSIPSHEHGLGSDGHALITFDEGDIFMRRTSNTRNWDATRRTNHAGPLDMGPSTAQISTGAELAGSTQFSGPWTSGSGGAGSTGAGGENTTGSGSSLPPALALNFIIKT
jgi:microcystin-dependent protein